MEEAASRLVPAISATTLHFHSRRCVADSCGLDCNSCPQAGSTAATDIHAATINIEALIFSPKARIDADEAAIRRIPGTHLGVTHGWLLSCKCRGGGENMQDNVKTPDGREYMLFALGVGAGLATGMLFAPKSGAEMRR